MTCFSQHERDASSAAAPTAVFHKFIAMEWIVLIVRLVLFGVFLTAAVGKLADRRGTRQAIADFGVPNGFTKYLVVLLPATELAIATLLIVGPWVQWAALAAVVMLALFIVTIVVNLMQGRTPNCHCFGQLHSKPIGWSIVLRNAFFASMAGFIFLRGAENSGVLSIAAGAGINPATWIALIVAGVALAIATLEAWLLLKLLPQQGRFLERLQTLEGAVGVGPGNGLRIGQQAPDFDLRTTGNARSDLKTLRSSGRPVMLFFMNPDCEPCEALLPEVAQWQQEHKNELEIAVISRGAVEANRDNTQIHGLQTVLLQKGREVAEAYQVDSTPAAVLVSADGSIASRIAYGAEDIEAFVKGVVNGTLSSSAPKADRGEHKHFLEPSGVTVGDPIPAVVLRDLEGNTIDFRGLGHDNSTLVLFWSPDCGFCKRMLPELKAWERHRPSHSPDLLIVSSGTVEANHATGLSSRIAIDADGSVMRTFGATGTPMALLVDDGRIASMLAVGSQQVMAMARSHESKFLPSLTG